MSCLFALVRKANFCSFSVWFWHKFDFGILAFFDIFWSYSDIFDSNFFDFYKQFSWKMSHRDPRKSKRTVTNKTSICE